jgi:hypothetical protein
MRLGRELKANKDILENQNLKRISSGSGVRLAILPFAGIGRVMYCQCK